MWQAPVAGWQGHPQPGHSPHALHYRFAGTNPGVVVIQQIYLPGWSVQVNGVALAATALEEQLLPDGCMQIRLAAGDHTIKAHYDGPPGAAQRDAGIGLALLLAAACWFGAAETAAAAAQAGRAGAHWQCIARPPQVRFWRRT